MGFFSPTADEVAQGHSLNDKVVIITGSSAGIGVELARTFYRIGARVIMANRSIDKSEAVAKEIKESLKDESTKGSLEVMKLDLMDFDSIKAFSEEFHKLNIPVHLLLLNAGIMAPPLRYTKQGYESQIGTNHLGHFLLTKLLMDKLKEAGTARVVATTSAGHAYAWKEWDWPTAGKKGFWSDKSTTYDKGKCYGHSKIANILFAKELSKRMKDEGCPNITAYSAHPGVVRTNLARDLGMAWQVPLKIFQFFLKNPEQGAASITFAALDDSMVNTPGAYCVPAQSWPYITGASKQAENMDDAARLWEESEKIVADWLK